MDTMRAGRSLLLGCVFWTFGVVAATLGELEWRGDIADNPIPDWLALACVASGSLLLMLGLRSFGELHGAELGRAGKIGYWIAFAGLGISIVAVWPFIVLGPFLAGIGLTVYGLERARLHGPASSGAWIHASSFPVGALVGFLGVPFGYDGGIGVLAFLGCVILGFVAIGLSMMTNSARVPEKDGLAPI